jgi:hypothetical protein
VKCEPLQDATPESELAHEDDTVVGRAFRWSLAVLAVLAAAGAAAYWLATRPKPAPPPQVAGVKAPEVARTAVIAPTIRFTDVTTEAGVDFVHENGAYGDKLLPETMGGGVAFLDYDLDGDQDLLFVDSMPWPERSSDGAAPPALALYANDGTGRFTNVTANAGLTACAYGMGVACGDYDCDGDPDLYLTALGENRLFRNDSGAFGEVDAGVAGDAGAWSTCAAFFDADGDGDLDLYVGNYVRWSKAIDLAVDYRMTGIGRSYGPPTNFEGAHACFYRNEGGGRFADVSREAGFFVANPATGVPMGKALGVAPLDVDGDGDLDLLVANDTVQKFLFVNRGDGVFDERGAELGFAFDRNGSATGAMGIDAAWYRNDATLGVVVGNFANEMSSLYGLQPGARIFADEAIGEGIGAPTRLRLTFGACFFDADLDGRLDLLHANGHIEDEIETVQASQSYAQAAQLFWNTGAPSGAAYVEAAAGSVGDLARPIVGRGAAYADIDGDGDLDVVLTQARGRPMVLRNDQALGNHWLRVKLVGAGCNREAIGAVVDLEASGVAQRRVVMPTRSYLSQCELPVTFGLGRETEVDRLTVTWPDGVKQDVPVGEVDRLVVVERTE